jgi:hypothetical protein
MDPANNAGLPPANPELFLYLSINIIFPFTGMFIAKHIIK